jgi:hypothetical protein
MLEMTSRRQEPVPAKPDAAPEMQLVRQASMKQSGCEDPTVPVRGFGPEAITRPTAAVHLWS